MSRKYTKIKELEPQILAMRAEGKTCREIAKSLGLEKKQIVNWVTRHNHEQARKEAGILPKKKGRPRKMQSQPARRKSSGNRPTRSND